MRKISYYLLLIFIITSCDSKEDLSSKKQALNNPMQLYIINGDIEYYSEITDGSKPKKPIFVYDIPEKTNEVTNLTSKTSEQSVTLKFDYGIGGSTKSGCTVKRYNNGNSYFTDDGVYGSIPYDKNGYLIRGFGTTHHNIYYNSLVLFASNQEEKSTDRTGKIWHDNNNNGSAISIEYPFKASVTYEISLKVTFYDNKRLINNAYSDGYPTIFAQLKDDGVIVPDEKKSCGKNGINNIYGYVMSGYDSYLVNYTRSYTLDSRAVIQRTINFKFSPTEKKNALVISLHPFTSTPGYGTPISTNDYTMTLPLINISEKPFDPSLNVEIKTPPRR
ncbi:hypothetical protein [uncultured Flavobacterium sp.]|uniref:hypothetical protein n=1 Tax=uncultured Flavobacterium sp. TaxID=165435 RepID=UPI00308214E6